MLQNTACDLLRELKSFPTAALSAVAEYIRSPVCDSLATRSRFGIHIHGGTGALPGIYNTWRNFLLEHLQGPPKVYLPRRTLLRAWHLMPYCDLIPKTSGELEIHAAHSYGGFVGMRRLMTHPESIARIILVGTPVHPEYIHQWARDNVARRILGIDTEAPLPQYLETLKVVFTSPNLLAKITVISSRGDIFFPPEACFIEGAEYIEVPDCAHVEFIYKEVALEAINSVVARTIKPHVPRRKAA